jgi:GR25 family glycosyltransferase involved in LPS biosynthesis
LINIKLYIMSWASVQSNVLQLQKDLYTLGFEATIVNSGPPINRDNWINITDDTYASRLSKALEVHQAKFADDFFMVICGDVSYTNWPQFFARAQYALKTTNIGVYAPHFTNSPFNPESIKIGTLDHLQGYIIASQTDSLVAVLHPEIAKMHAKFLSKLSTKTELSTFTHGWGIDIIWSILAIVTKKLVVTDLNSVLTHPLDGPYNFSQAANEMDVFLESFFKYCDSIKVAGSVEVYKKIKGRFSGGLYTNGPKFFYEGFELYNNYVKNPPFHIISISRERKAEQDAVKQRLGSNWVLIDSLNGYKDEDVISFYEEHSDLKYIKTPPLAKGEIGVYGSHYLAWEYAAKNNVEGLLIFEDDALLHDNFVAMYNYALFTIPEDYDVFSMYVDKDQYSRYNNSQYYTDDISKGYQDWSLVGYFVSSKGAKKLVEAANVEGISRPCDWFLFRNGHAGLFNVYTWSPRVNVPMAINTSSARQIIRN